MGFFDDSIFGIDFNGDGKADFMDDILFAGFLEEEEKRLNGEEDDDD